VHNNLRYYVCFGVIPFDDSHTSVALAAWLKELLDSWGITDRVNVITSDTAANMKALMRYLHKDGCPQTNTVLLIIIFVFGLFIISPSR
jgi:hypothetical protein